MARMYKIMDEQMVVEEEICEILDANMMMEYEDEEDKSGDRMDEIDEEGWRRTNPSVHHEQEDDNQDKCIVSARCGGGTLSQDESQNPGIWNAREIYLLGLTHWTRVRPIWVQPIPIPIYVPG